MDGAIDDDEYCSLDKCKKHEHKIEHTGAEHYRRPRRDTFYKCSRCLKTYFFKCYSCQEKDEDNSAAPPILPWQTPYTKRNHCIDPCPNCNEYICKCNILPKHIIPINPYKREGSYKPEYWQWPPPPLDFPYPLGYNWSWQLPPGPWPFNKYYFEKMPPGYWDNYWEWQWPSYPIIPFEIPEDLKEAVKYQVASTILQYWWDPDEFWEDYAYGLEKHKEYCREKGIPVPDDPNTQYAFGNLLRKSVSTTIKPALLKRFNMSFPGGPGFPPMGGGGGGFHTMEQYEEQLRVSCTVVFD